MPMTGKNFLVVEDEGTSAIIMYEILTSMGGCVDVVSQYDFENVLYDKIDIYDAVITDLYMDDLNGTEVFHLTKKRRPEKPVILYSCDPNGSLADFESKIKKPATVERTKKALDNIFKA